MSFIISTKITSFPPLFLISFTLIIACNAFADGQFGLWSNRCTSAPAVGESLYFNVDTPKSSDPPTHLYYSVNGGVVWPSRTMELVGDVGYETTWQTVLTLPKTDRLNYYFRLEFPDSLVITESPPNSSEQFPPSDDLLVSGGDEPSGDVKNDSPNWMDLTGLYCGFSPDRLYGMMQNNSNQWPTSGGFFGPWYIYSAGFSNVTVDLQADSVLYAMIYANIPFAGITPGLYRVLAGDIEHPRRIGDIEYSLNGNKLYLSCLKNDILEDPYFGAWPNEYYALGFGTMTHTTRGYGTTVTNDSTTACGFVPHVSTGIVGANTAPELTEPAVIDTNGFCFCVSYSDMDNHLPIMRELVLNDEHYKLAASDHRYNDGSLFHICFDSLATGTYIFSFRFSDGVDEVSTSTDTLVICTQGDVTGDASLNVLDALRAVNIILESGDPATDHELCAADMDENGQINVLDVVGIVNLILGTPNRIGAHFNVEPHSSVK